VPDRTPRLCASPGCPRTTTEGPRCPDHTRAPRADPRPNAAGRGYGWTWEKVARVVRAEEPWCRICKAEGRYTLTTDVDHIIPRAAGGTDDRTNLRGLCGTCHKRVTASYDGGFGRTRRPKPR